LFAIHRSGFLDDKRIVTQCGAVGFACSQAKPLVLDVHNLPNRNCSSCLLRKEGNQYIDPLDGCKASSRYWCRMNRDYAGTRSKRMIDESKTRPLLFLPRTRQLYVMTTSSANALEKSTAILLSRCIRVQQNSVVRCPYLDRKFSQKLGVG